MKKPAKWGRLVALLRRSGSALAAIGAPAAYRVTRVLGCVGVAAALLFAAATCYAIWAGWGLPTTFILRSAPAARWLAIREPWLGFALIACATIGVITSWLTRLLPDGGELLAREEACLLRFFQWTAIPVAAGIFVFSMSAMWAGFVRPGDLHYSSIGGLIPFSDAADHLVGAYDQARDGVWDFALRRPLSAAVRSCVLLIAGYSLPLMLVIQVVILAAALCLACLSIARWRGAWAALAFFGLNYTYARTFAPTALSEPLSLAWSYLSIPFFVAALRTGSRPQALFGLAATTTALMIRMGSMFTIPALMAWIVLRRGERHRGRAAGLCVAVVLGVVALNSALAGLYGTERGLTAGNFSYTLCGLTIGTDWTGCPAKLEAEGKTLPSDENATDLLVYRMAAENFAAHPGVFFHRLFLGARNFVARVPLVTWGGYGGAVARSGWISKSVISAVMLLGLYLLLRRQEADEWSFWLLIGTSVVLSAAVVYFDDGQRVLSAGYVLLFFLFALGLALPQDVKGPAQRVALFTDRGAGYAASILTVLALGGPGLSHIVYGLTQPVREASGIPADEHIVSGRHLAGFLIVADGDPLRKNIPSLHYADFSAIMKSTPIAEGRVLLETRRPPFGFVFAPNSVHEQRSVYGYIAPPAVLEQRGIRQWRFRISPLTPDWFEVTSAEPVLQEVWQK